MLLQDKVTLITGAGRGLGQAVAVAYARQGARVIVTGRTPGELEHTAGLIRSAGGHTLALAVDVADDAAMAALAGEVLGRYGRLDVLVNNAGQLMMKSFEEMTLAEWDNILRVNLRGVVLGCKLFLGAMKTQGGGSIINVSSNAGVIGLRTGIGLLRLQVRDRGLQPRAGAGAAAVQHRRQHHHPRQAARRRDDQAHLADPGAVRRAQPGRASALGRCDRSSPRRSSSWRGSAATASPASGCPPMSCPSRSARRAGTPFTGRSDETMGGVGDEPRLSLADTNV